MHRRHCAPSDFMERGGGGDVHVRQPVRRHGVAGRPVQRRHGSARHHGVRAPAGRVARCAGALGLVRPPLGPHRMRAGRRHGAARLRHRRLRLRHGRVRRGRRGAPSDAGRVHARRHGRAGLLRRQPGGRVQPAGAGGAVLRGAPRRRVDRRVLRFGGVRGGPERDVPRRAPVRRRRGLPERVRRVRAARVLLQRRLRQPRDVPADVLLAGVQDGLPALLQLRLRRPHLHLHLRRRPRLHRHLLPRRHPEPEVDHGAGGHNADANDPHADDGACDGYAGDDAGDDVHGRQPGQHADADGRRGRDWWRRQHPGAGRDPRGHQQRRLARQHGHRRRDGRGSGSGSLRAASRRAIGTARAPSAAIDGGRRSTD
uniref:Uncharacterized protein n=1 Tax=Triticum urartu TaxID=4572 RepID=A0A8R7PC05_TRIUA